MNLLGPQRVGPAKRKEKPNMTSQLRKRKNTSSVIKNRHMNIYASIYHHKHCIIKLNRKFKWQRRDETSDDAPL